MICYPVLLFRSVLLCSVLFFSVLFCSVPFRSVLFPILAVFGAVSLHVYIHEKGGVFGMVWIFTLLGLRAGVSKVNVDEGWGMGVGCCVGGGGV